MTQEGELLRIPRGWSLVKPGDPALSRRIKKAGPTWTVKEKRGRKIFSRGIWAPTDNIRHIQQALEQERAAPAYQQKLDTARKRRAVQQEEYAEDFEYAVIQFLNFHTRYQLLAKELASRIAQHAVPVGSGTVARTQRIPIEQRAEAATIAWMRHQTTAYDRMHIPRARGKRREVRRMLAEHSHHLLEQYRKGSQIDVQACPLQLAIKLIELPSQNNLDYLPAALTMKIEKILTHPGGSHKDELLACCLLLAKHPVPIVRREPTEADLEDVATIVVDVGHEHDPAKNNFDHHQFPKDHPPTCSLSLILKHFDLYDDALQFCDWLEPAEWFDCRGAIETAKWLGVERDIVNRFVSPIDITLLRRFAAESQLNPGETLWEVMKMVGEDLLDYLLKLKERLVYIEEHASVWELEAQGRSFKILFMPRTSPLPDEPSSGLGLHIENQGLESTVIGMVYPDRRSDGYGLSRYEDSPALDFTQISEEPDVHFAHARGFVAKTSAIDEDRLQALVLQAVTNIEN